MKGRAAIRCDLAHSLSLLLAAGCMASAREPDGRVQRELSERIGHAPPSDPSAASLPPDVDPGDGLDADEAVAIALWNDPRFRAVLAEMGLARADLAQAGRLRNPSFSFLFAVGDKQAEATLTAPLESWFTRGARVRAARQQLAAVAEQVISHGVGLAAAVESEVAELAAARDLAGVGRRLADAARAVAGLEAARRDAGDASPDEALAAQERALDAELALARAETAAGRAQSRLRLRFGAAAPLVPLDHVHPADPLDPEELPPGLAPDGWASARPDVRAAGLEVEAAAARVDSAAAGRVPVGVLADANSDGEHGWEIGPGLAVELPLFDDGSARIAWAGAALELAKSRHEAAAAAAREEIEFALAELRLAAGRARRERGERLSAAERRRAAVRTALARGAVSPLDLARADLTRLEAEASALAAELEWRRATARLVAAVGADPRKLDR